ncbi:hypothetical protein V3C99_006641, partial [Haemonchus contortus]
NELSFFASVMSKIHILGAGATALVGAIVVASLVLNVFTYIRMRDTPKKEKVPLSTSRSPLTPYTTLTSTNRIETTSYANVDNVFCPNVGNANRSKEWKNAANTLLFGLDESVDPCEDFYGFTCNKFIERIDLDELGRGRFTTFSQAQLEVNSDIVKALEKVDVNDEKFSQTERITKAAFQSCVEYTLKDDRKASVNELLQYISERFGGIPFLGQRVKGGCELYREMGRIEQQRALPTFMYTWVNVDHKNVSRNSYYISQPTLPMPREFYVLPQFAPELDARTKAIENVMKAFASDILKDPSKYDKMIKTAAREVTQIEQKIAMASWPDDELRNHEQQYNPYELFAPSEGKIALQDAFPNIRFGKYIAGLMETATGGVPVSPVFIGDV